MRAQGDLAAAFGFSRHRSIDDAPAPTLDPQFAEAIEPETLEPESITISSLLKPALAPLDPPKMTFAEIRREVLANKRFASRLLISTYRLAQRSNKSVVRRAITHGFHRIVSLILRAELPPDAAIGPGLRIERTFCIIVHPATRIGARCVLRHGVTLDVRFEGDDQAPVIGNDVQFGAYCVAIGPVEVSDNAHLQPHSQVHHTQRATSLAAQAALSQN
ncbi:MAG TPA: hypothetical protein VGO52_01985 [Hyphomonadaceae bacterium]|jgi:serine acetyltransferase|nr:hypothetical protein [Hyphomonadaceae bacterium]